MPILSINGVEIDLPRNVALLDTNVLVAYADDQDNDHASAILAIDENTDFLWLVTLPVVVEACGLLGRRRDHGAVLDLLLWLLTPGNVTLLPGSHPSLSPDGAVRRHSDWMRQYVLDYVDSHLMDIADTLTQSLQLMPDIPIATFDTADFFRCAGRGRRYSLYNVREFELIDFAA